MTVKISESQFVENLNKQEAFSRNVVKAREALMVAPDEATRAAQKAAVGSIRKVGKADLAVSGDSILNPQDLTDFGLFSIQDAASQMPVLDAVPMTSVMARKGKWWVWNRAHTNRINRNPRARGSATEAVRVSLSDDDYTCQLYGEHFPLDEVTLLDSSSIQNLRQGVAQILASWVVRHRIDEIIDVMFAADAFDDLTTSTPTTKWDAGGDFIEDVDDAKRDILYRTGKMPNRCLMKRSTFDKIKRNSNVIMITNGASSTGSPAIITEMNLAAILGFEQLVLVDTIETTSVEKADPNAAGTIGAMLKTDDVVMYYAPAMLPSDGMGQTAVQMFVCNNLPGFTGMGVRFSEYENIDGRVTKIEADNFYVTQITDKALGGKLSSVLT